MIAIRGATTTDADEATAIREAVRELLVAITGENGLSEDDIVSAIFTATGDLTACFPAEAARELGWTDVPLMCAQEIPVRGSLKRCLRVLMHADLDVPKRDVRHVYLRGARDLRPDLLRGDEDK